MNTPCHSRPALVGHVQTPDLSPQERHVPALDIVDHGHSHAGTLNLFTRTLVPVRVRVRVREYHHFKDAQQER